MELPESGEAALLGQVLGQAYLHDIEKQVGQFFFQKERERKIKRRGKEKKKERKERNGKRLGFGVGTVMAAEQ